MATIEKNRRPRWKGDTKNMKKVKTVRISNTDGLKRKQQRIKKKKKAQNVPRDEVSRAKRTIKYLFLKMKLEHNLIDEYSGEGWKGQRFVYQIHVLMGWEYDQESIFSDPCLCKSSFDWKNVRIRFAASS